MKNPRYSFFGVAIAVAFLAIFSGSAVAQCDRVGNVLSKSATCGALLLDLESREIFLAVDGANDRSVGETFSFSSNTATMLPNGCIPGNEPVVELTCASDELPCNAEFAQHVDTENPHLLHFKANVYDPSKQVCSWDFGFGETAVGDDVSVVFPEKGTYSVCLTVQSGNCTKEVCRNIVVTDVSPQDCGFEMQLTAIGLQLYGKLRPLTTAGQSDLTQVRWYNGKSGQTFSDQNLLQFPLPDYGRYNVCVEYEAAIANGDACKTEDCASLVVQEPGCHNLAFVDEGTLCPDILVPVCGCDGNTYNNECEAMVTGLTKWWVGDCASQSANCSADFEIQILSGNPDDGYDIEFTNRSGGQYFHTAFDFGDGSPLHEEHWTTLTHHYEASGMFMAQLSIWQNEDKVSVASALVATDAASIHAGALPNGTGYVMPGDSDGDGKANVEDLLNIGAGYYHEGAPRPNASLDWVPQLSPDWGTHNAHGINFKHADCDGNGLVNEFDPGAISLHYQAVDTFTNAHVQGAPTVYLKMPTDTIVLQGNSPVFNITADLMVGQPTKPVLGLYGLSMAMAYPEYVNHNTIGYYTGEDFFGESNLVLWMQRNNYNEQQLDMGFVRKTGEPISGYGRLAKIDFQSDFIIIVDVILREEKEAVPFVVNIKSLQGIDEHGNEVPLNVQTNTDTVWIKVSQTSGIFGNEKTSEIGIYPNPVQTVAQVDLPTDVKANFAEIYNLNGQLMQRQALGQGQNSLDVAELTTGIYQVRITSEDGVFVGKLIKE